VGCTVWGVVLASDISWGRWLQTAWEYKNIARRRMKNPGKRQPVKRIEGDAAGKVKATR